MDSRSADIHVRLPLAPQRAPVAVVEDHAPAPEMNRQERVAFTLYVAMGALIVAFLAAMCLTWLLGA